MALGPAGLPLRTIAAIVRRRVSRMLETFLGLLKICENSKKRALFGKFWSSLLRGFGKFVDRF